jgi:hypothetical protein
VRGFTYISENFVALKSEKVPARPCGTDELGQSKPLGGEGI